jgi:hypothetical protein
MVVYNRRKRNEWYVVQQELHKRDLLAARQAMSQGTADEDQILLINQERLREEVEAEKVQKKGMFTKAKENLFGTEKKEEKRGGTMGITGITGREQTEELGVVKAVQEKVAEGKEKARSNLTAAYGNQGGSSPDDKQMQVLLLEQQKNKQLIMAGGTTGQSSNPKTVAGGPLDQLGEKTAESASKATKSWTDWALRR